MLNGDRMLARTGKSECITLRFAQFPIDKRPIVNRGRHDNIRRQKTRNLDMNILHESMLIQVRNSKRNRLARTSRNTDLFDRLNRIARSAGGFERYAAPAAARC